jgi:hypothetical protein
MNNKVKKVRNILIGITVSIIALVAIVIIFISPITKYLIQKYDVKYLGREITLDWVYVNPFTGYAHISNLKVYEAGGMDTVFFSSEGASVNFAMMKMLKKTYEIENVTLTMPWGRIVQDRRSLNFDDIIERFTPKKDSTITIKINKEPVHFNILDIKLVDGEFHYEERSIPISYYIKNVNITSTGKWWNIDSMPIQVALKSGPSGGDIKGLMDIDFRTLDYNFVAQIHDYDLKFLEQYLRDITNYGTFSAHLDGDIKAKGNFKIKLAVEAKGWLAVNNFHFGRVKGDDYLSFDKLFLKMVDLNPRAYSYYVDTLTIEKPYFKYELYDHMDNVTALFGKDLKNIKSAVNDKGRFNLVIEIGKYVNDIIKNFIQSYYKVNHLGIIRGDLRFNDFALREQFSIAATPMTLTADSIDKNNKRINAYFATGINPYGAITVSISLNPNNYGTFNLNYKIDKVPVSLFNPYLISYTSFPLDRGSLDFNGHLNVIDSNISSENHLLIVDPRVGKRIKAKDTKWIPMPLIMSIVRERSGVIDYSIPIVGSLRDPKFKLKYVILNIIGNIFVKPPSSAYLYHVVETERTVEKYQTLKWETRKITLRAGQEAFMKKIAKFLRESPDASIKVSPMEYTTKEKEYIVFFEAKKKYWMTTRKLQSISEDDSVDIDRMSNKDSLFMSYLDRFGGDTMMFTIQEKCRYYVGESIISKQFTQLMRDRQSTFMSFFDGDVKSRVAIDAEQTVVPFNGFSYYKIEYKEQIPPKLMDAYYEMTDINDEKPRKQYLKARKQNESSLPTSYLPGK